MIIRIFYIIFLVILASCKKETVEHVHEHSESGMNNMLHLTTHDQLVANIKIDTVKESPIAAESVVLGVVSVNEKNVTVISARLAGRLDRLYVRNPLQAIHQGDLLYSIYSEQLLSDEKSFLLALEQQGSKVASLMDINAIVHAAQKKLILWGLNKRQIDNLKATRKPSATLDFFSPTSGIVTDVSVREGEYVQTGSSIVKIAGLQTLWVDAQLYVNEVSFLEQHPTVTIHFDAHPHQVFAAKLAFINPVVEQQRKINIARFEVINQSNLLKPGEMAYVHLKRNEHKGLIIPKSSIILESDMVSVWIQTGKGMYEKRMIEIGIADGTSIEVLSGLEKNEVIVTSGAYLLNSAFVLRNGANAMGGMKM